MSLASAAVVPAVAWRGPDPPSGTAPPSGATPASGTTPCPAWLRRAHTTGRRSPYSGFDRRDPAQPRHNQRVCSRPPAGGNERCRGPAGCRGASEDCDHGQAGQAVSSPHHRQPCAPPGDADDELRLRAAAVGGLGQVPAVPDLDLRVRARRGRQGVLRGGLRPAREGAGGRAGADLLAHQQSRSRDPRGSAGPVGRRGIDARVLERHGRDLDHLVDVPAPGRRAGAQRALVRRHRVPGAQHPAAVRHPPGGVRQRRRRAPARGRRSRRRRSTGGSP